MEQGQSASHSFSFQAADVPKNTKKKGDPLSGLPCFFRACAVAIT
jgi:hypothetical protein